MHCPLKQRAIAGATLIEVMVALVIMSIGLLGLASLQLSGIRNNSNSEKRTQAAVIANDLVERMRANPVAVTGDASASINAGQYATALPVTPTIDCTTQPAKICEDSSAASADCTPSDMATYDAFTEWCKANTLLPSAKLYVTCTDLTGAAQACSATSYRTVTVGWSDQVDGGSKNKTLSMTFQP